MAITTKKPPIKETVGAQYICFDQSEDGEYSGEYSEEEMCIRDRYNRIKK